MLRILASLGGIANVVLASSCWRDTACTGLSQASFPGPWEANMYSPHSRSIQPKSILSSSGEHIIEYENGRNILLNQGLPSIVMDFGLEVGGLVSLDYNVSGLDTPTFGLAFTEAKDYIGPMSDSSRGGNGGKPGDGPLLVNATSEGHYTMPDAKLRGGFRYLTIFLDNPSNGVALDITDITLEISFQPTWSNLRAYGGYFDSDDELLNKIWYSGAYTVQTNSVPGNTGRVELNPSTLRGWQNNAVITKGDTVLLDGAKRDRWVWIGDMGTAVPSAFVGIGELDSTKNALLAIYDNQREDGMFPKAGPPYVVWDSDTYHLWAMIGTYNYLLYSGDVDLAQELWPKYEAALNYTTSTLNADGIISVKGVKDWGRLTSSNERSSASMLFYHALTTGAKIASWLPEEAGIAGLSKTYTALAKTLRNSIIDQFWDEDLGAFTESPKTSTLHPQDANSFALAFGVVTGTQADRVSDYLASTWTPIGPSSPELPNNISPFISSVELHAHFQANRPDRALELMRSLWGYYLTHENGTQSTTPEGFLTDGSWGYRCNQGYSNGPAYMSHAHCWSSGPTSTLTELMVGLRVTGPAGKEWALAPATFRELTRAQAGFTTTLGKFSAKFEVRGKKVIIEWDTPEGTKGVVALPGRKAVEVRGGKGSTSVLV